MLHFNKKIFTTVLVDFLPIFVFIIFFELFNFFEATVAIIVATVISFIVAILKEKRVPVFMFITATLTFVFGYATLLYDSSNILKLKDTFFDFAAGTILLFGLVVFKRIIVKDFFKHVFSYTDHG
jgi:intracellular septation protein